MPQGRKRQQPIAGRGGTAGSDQHWVCKQGIRVGGPGSNAAPEAVVAEYSSGHAAKLEASLTGGVKDIVDEACVARPCAAPVVTGDKRNVQVFAEIKNIVVDLRVPARTGDVESMEAIVDTHIAADYRAAVADVLGHLLAAIVADEHEAAVVIVTEVMLEQRIAAVVIRIVPLAVQLTVHPADFVIFDHRIVAGPGPDPRRVILCPHPPAAQDIVRHAAAVTADWDNAISTDVFEHIALDDDVCGKRPLRPGIIRAQCNPIPIGAGQGVVFNDKAIIAGLNPAAAAGAVNPIAAAFAFDIGAENIVNSQVMQAKAVRSAELLQADLNTGKTGNPPQRSVCDVQVPMSQYSLLCKKTVARNAPAASRAGFEPGP